jgi:hypothetical protein
LHTSTHLDHPLLPIPALVRYTSIVAERDALLARLNHERAALHDAAMAALPFWLVRFDHMRQYAWNHGHAKGEWRIHFKVLWGGDERRGCLGERVGYPLLLLRMWLSLPSPLPLPLPLPALLGSAMLCGSACVLLGHPLRLNFSYPPPPLLHAHAHEKHPVR